MGDLQFLSELYVPIVMAICLCVGYVLKQWTNDEKHRIIPTVLAVLGAVCSCIHARSITLELIAAGAIRGLASTGVHQAFKQLI